LLGLLSIRRHDEYTFQHSLNICLLALALGMAMGLSRARLQELGLAALLHDVGKAWEPLEVLRKPGPLDEGEAALINGIRWMAPSTRQQPDIPASGTGGVPASPALTRPAILLRWLLANTYSLIGIADAYEALTSERPYRPTLRKARGCSTPRQGSSNAPSSCSRRCSGGDLWRLTPLGSVACGAAPGTLRRRARRSRLTHAIKPAQW
jgi:hypothetical protein